MRIARSLAQALGRPEKQMSTRDLRTSIVLAVAVVLVACAPARPVEALRPQYPALLASARYGGTIMAPIRVDRTGYATLLWTDTISSGAPALFRQAIHRAVRATAWRPARRWGRVRTDTLRYEVAYVLLRDTLPLGVNEQYFLGNDTLPLRCPAAQTPRQIVVCAIPGRVRYQVVY